MQEQDVRTQNGQYFESFAIITTKLNTKQRLHLCIASNDESTKRAIH